MKVKSVLGKIGICVAMVLVGWVPESDLPKQEGSIFDGVVTAIYSTVYKVNEMKVALEKAREEVVEEEVEEVVEEVIEEVEEEVEEYQEEYTEEYVEEEYVEEETTDNWGNNMVYLGVYDITAYEWTGYPCANGNYPSTGYTVACNSLPLGTVLYIDGIGYRTVEDRGATWHSDNWIDLYLGDVSACYEWGIRSRDVWIVY